MDQADERLKALFAEDLPATHDAAFSAEVMAAVMRRRFRGELIWLAGAAALVGLAVWALWPALQPVLVSVSRDFAPVAAVVTLTASAIFMLGGRLGRELGFQS